MKQTDLKISKTFSTQHFRFEFKEFDFHNLICSYDIDIQNKEISFAFWYTKEFPYTLKDIEQKFRNEEIAIFLYSGDDFASEEGHLFITLKNVKFLRYSSLLGVTYVETWPKHVAIKLNASFEDYVG